MAFQCSSDLLGYVGRGASKVEHRVLRGLPSLLILAKFKDMGTAYGKHGTPRAGFCLGWELG